MRIIFTSLLIALSQSCFSQDNWVTIYEAGNGADSSIYDAWSNSFRYESDENGPNVTNTIGGIYEFNQGGVELLYYSDNFGAGLCGIKKRIPTMENYASLRIFLSVELPDSVGTISYATMQNDIYNEELGTHIWYDFDSVAHDITIPFTNTYGHNGLFLYADLLRGDSVSVKFNYVRVEADTTLLNNPVTAADYLIYSSASSIFIVAPNNTDNYLVEIFNSTGNNLYTQNFTGNQTIDPMLEPGIYYVRITDPYGGVAQNTVYLN